MTERLIQSIPSEIWELSDIFTKSEFDLFLVGGCVRDALVDKDPKDFDLATNATPTQIRKILRGKFGTHAIGEQFGVILVVSDDNEFEIATFREDIGDDGRKPESISFTTIEKDVLRRDLTINGLFFDLHKRVIVDLVGGADDLHNKVIRTIGNASDRFIEDNLRKLRAVRFASVLGKESKFDADTLRILLRDPIMRNVSAERKRDEFIKIFDKAQDREHAIGLLDRFSMLSQIFDHFISWPMVNKEGINDFKHIESLLIRLVITTTFNPSEARQLLHNTKWTNIQCSVVEFMMFLIQLRRFTQNGLDEFNIICKHIAEITKLKNKLIGEDKKSIDDLISIGIEAGIFREESLISRVMKWELSAKRSDVGSELKGQEIGKAIAEMESKLFIDTMHAASMNNRSC